jgi:hypothetical protein
MAEHRLKDDTLVREADGIVAYCVCGWKSQPAFSSMMASLSIRSHIEFEAAERRVIENWNLIDE